MSDQCFLQVMGGAALLIAGIVMGLFLSLAITVRSNRKFFDRITGEYIGPERRRQP